MIQGEGENMKARRRPPHLFVNIITEKLIMCQSCSQSMFRGWESLTDKIYNIKRWTSICAKEFHSRTKH